MESEKLKALNDVEEIRLELIKVKEGDKEFEYGLNRHNLLSRRWHEKNPRAAKHLFGCIDWKDTVYLLHALFEVLPPMKAPSKKELNYIVERPCFLLLDQVKHKEHGQRMTAEQPSIGAITL